jgi:hypothetical protein
MRDLLVEVEVLGFEGEFMHKKHSASLRVNSPADTLQLFRRGAKLTVLLTAPVNDASSKMEFSREPLAMPGNTAGAAAASVVMMQAVPAASNVSSTGDGAHQAPAMGAHQAQPWALPAFTSVLSITDPPSSSTFL